MQRTIHITLALAAVLLLLTGCPSPGGGSRGNDPSGNTAAPPTDQASTSEVATLDEGGRSDTSDGEADTNRTTNRTMILIGICVLVPWIIWSAVAGSPLLTLIGLLIFSPIAFAIYFFLGMS